eukprot:CAMPEP_0196753538 /NCGR_PEP_ID=MMETSP1091-20130531/91140_1 /TAXON_ID=302021 /ORGANISM="Rhodomonas sp., Strain CCMP768" /LENGTH=74 /DNA_ID=CAMNT_0042101669 /DNA_START=180 /DNA_END=401 /DNA_ORIENTATION=+
MEQMSLNGGSTEPEWLECKLDSEKEKGENMGLTISAGRAGRNDPRLGLLCTWRQIHSLSIPPALISRQQAYIPE